MSDSINYTFIFVIVFFSSITFSCFSFSSSMCVLPIIFLIYFRGALVCGCVRGMSLEFLLESFWMCKFILEEVILIIVKEKSLLFWAKAADIWWCIFRAH